MILEIDKKLMNFSFIIVLTFLLFPSITHSFSFKNNHILNDKVNLNQEKSITIEGKITDAKTNKAIPFCNIMVKENNFISASNELGEFSIKIDSFPATILVSHLSYKTKEIKVTNRNSLIVELTSFENKLDEVILTNKNSKKAIGIINKTINKFSSSNSTPVYGKSLYRQRSKNDDSFSEFAEIIYDVKFDNDGIMEWDIFEGRYALKKETINNKNFTLLSKILRVHQPNSDDLIFPLIRGFLKYYNVKITNINNTNNGELVTIKFTPLNNIKTPIIKANVVINTKTNDVIKVNGSLKNDDIKIVSLRDKNAVKKNYILNFEISYRKDDVFGLVLDYINLNHEFDYYKENKLLTHLYATSNLHFFEYYNENPKIKKRKDKTKRKRFKYKSSDWDKLDIIGYNKSFWDNNPIVKRTETENDVIESFEELRAFESIFINAQQQISINSSDITSDPFILEISENISKHYAENQTQKVFLHTDKNNYLNENKIYYSAYVTSENIDTTFNENDILYVDLIKGKNIIAAQTIKIANGRGYGTFSSHKNFSPGNYKIAAYTDFMKNFSPNQFFIKDIEILNSVKTKVNSENENLIFNFYPEGGQIVNEIINKVAYKAEDSNGNVKNVQGKLIDSDGNFISTIKSKHEGLGFFYLKPKKGMSYAIVLDDGTIYDIPNSVNSGYSIIADNINSRTMTVNIRSSDNLKSDSIYVLGLMDNKKYYQGSFTFSGKDVINFEIPKNKFPGGVMQLALLDKSKKVIGFRPVYINNNDDINIEAEFDKNYVDPEFVKLKIKTNNNIDAASNISLSITGANHDKELNSDDNLISHFKLSSYRQNDRMTRYINKTDRISNYKLDLMMLINDSFDFNWLESNSNYKVKKYQNKKGIDIQGVAKDKKGNPLKNIKLKLLTKNRERIWNYETITNNDGGFTIDNFEEVDSTSLEFRTYDIKDQQIFSKISLIEEKKFNYLNELDFDQKDMSATLNNNSLNNSSSAFTEEGELLENVELQAKIEEKRPRKSYLVTNPDGIIEGNSVNGGSNLFRALSTIPGVKYVSDHYIDGGESISIRNSDDPPLWILDGMKISGPEAINIKDIERIEVAVSLSKSAVFGPEGVNGVVLFYSKEGVDSQYDNSIKASTFRKVIYNSPAAFNNKNNGTLYWNPFISTDENGYVELLLNKSSSTLKFLNVNIQAINKDGEIGYFNKILKLE